MHRHTIFTIPPALAFLLVAGTASAQTPITHCGASWSGAMVLIDDLDCSDSPVPAVTLAIDARLDLAGFTLVGGSSTAVTCAGSCTIEGAGGTITGAQLSGVAAAAGRVAVSNLTVSANGEHGIAGGELARVVASNVTASNNGKAGISSRRALDASGCTLMGNRDGFIGEKHLAVTNSVASGTGIGALSAGRASIVGSTFSSALIGVQGARVVKLVNTTVTGSERHGVQAIRIRAKNSTIAGNAQDAVFCVDPSFSCADLIADRRPRVQSTTCETSARLLGSNGDGTWTAWGVCTND